MMTKHIYYTIVVMVLCTVSASAQWNTYSEAFNGSAQAPTAAFRSTSTMAATNSAYASTPSIGDDGSAVGMYATAPSSGPRKVGPPTPEGDPTPLGDAALPLLLMAGAYAFIRVRRVRRDFC